MTRNYELVYYVAQNVGIIGILAYSKINILISDFHTTQNLFLKIKWKKSMYCVKKVIDQHKILN